MSADAPTPRSEEARRLVRLYAFGGVVPAAIPIPALDAGLILAVQLKMVHGLAKLYGVPFEQERARSLIAGLAGGALAATSALTVARAVPIAGALVSAVTVGALGGATTWATGLVFMQHFETGGTLLTFDPEQVRAHYEAVLARRAPDASGAVEGPRKP